MMKEQTKVCKGCNKALPVAEFASHRTNRDGLNGKCKACEGIHRRAHYHAKKNLMAAHCFDYYRYRYRDKPKRCSGCRRVLPRTAFYKARHKKDGTQTFCKKCTSGRNDDRYRRSIRTQFGITPHDYEKILVMQGHQCAICGCDQADCRQRFAIDHNHKTGEIRGLLCTNCNIGLGHFQDNPEVLRRAISYLAGEHRLVATSA